MLPKALDDLIEALGSLPGVGPRTAERYAWSLFKRPESKLKDLTESISSLHERVKLCPKTFALISEDEDLSELYSDNRRDKKVVMVVEQPFDIIPLEKTSKFNGTYHVLGGAISPIDGINASDLKIAELIQRVKDDEVEELILATNANIEGESTALYIQKILEEAGEKVKMTRLARGLPTGVDLAYADQITLSHAFDGRKEF
ncbi:MAG: recombination protein RecR [Candidatus Nomurabacteria bacterium]|nr:MAG: recombination protein RecR [Candidatus Nomurabacteria bacterium]